jgi:short-subunit dehydrogenase involved in D-alanine esterification of teichoic acids
VIVAVRNRELGQKAVDHIVLESGNKNVELEILDLGSLKSIKEFAERIKSKHSRLDILINNAGKNREIGLYNASFSFYQSHYINKAWSVRQETRPQTGSRCTLESTT